MARRNCSTSASSVGPDARDRHQPAQLGLRQHPRLDEAELVAEAEVGARSHRRDLDDLDGFAGRQAMHAGPRRKSREEVAHLSLLRSSAAVVN